MLRRLGDLLQERGEISSADIEKARMVQAENGGLFGQSLLRIGALSEDSLLETLSLQLGLDILSAASGLPDEQAIRETARQLQLNTRWLAEKQAVAWFTDREADTSSDRCTLVLTGIHPQDIELLEVIEARLALHGREKQVQG